MTDEQKREYAEAIKCALGMGGYGPPMEGEEGWSAMAICQEFFVDPPAMTVEDADDESADAIAEHLEQTAKERAANAQAVIDAIREAKERRLAKEREAAAEPKPAPPSDDPWAVIGKAEDDGEWIMKKVRDFG